ncbi:MAG: endonuclease/exonuclease/phosphatase family protein [Bacteroidales bacterium]|jgi:endonuclease/exonuclease/phosphatase family metal-dependent hydrolase|nr:endonuclease/exonuclease/phosphatase family protein [Bacteroidales bacterium]
MAKKTVSFLNIILLFCNVIVILALLTSYLANYLNPKVYFLAGLSGLFYPYILIANVFFVVIWLFRKWKYCLLSLIAILTGFNSIERLYQFHRKIMPADTSQLVKVMSYNVQILGLYSKSNNKEKIIQFLKEERPDIICLQEYCQTNSFKNGFVNAHHIQEALHLKNYSLHTPLSRNNYLFGMAIFSKYPIIHQGTISFKDAKTNHAMFADLKINSDTVRIYNVHFQSIHFGAEDYLFAQQAASNPEMSNEQWKEHSVRILKKIKTGFAKRSAQVDTIVNHINLSPYRVIVCGDFNDTPWSYTYQQIRNLLEDAFVKSGNGFGYSMIINKLLSFRIDYIFYDKSFQSYDFTTGNIRASDHYPVSTYIEINKE